LEQLSTRSLVAAKSPKKDSSKKPGRSLKEKRAAKHEKQRANKTFGDRSTS
jgi:hypothetical protein